MLRFIGRILVILLVSGLIVGGIYLIVQQNPSALGIGDGQPGFEGHLRNNLERIDNGSELPQESIASNARPSHFPGGDHDLEGGASIGRGLMGITRNLIVFSLITLLVVAIQKLFSWLNRKRLARAA